MGYEYMPTKPTTLIIENWLESNEVLTKSATDIGNQKQCSKIGGSHLTTSDIYQLYTNITSVCRHRKIIRRDDGCETRSDPMYDIEISDCRRSSPSVVDCRQQSPIVDDKNHNIFITE
uniref:Uncharacterized protein n=1 Tax=Romanomermis culicivorax TaxID=13658 RepID=A0A915JA35_ROMCU